MIRAFATAARTSSIAAFLAVFAALAATCDPLDLGIMGRAALGGRFWMGLGPFGVGIAVISLSASILLSAPEGPTRDWPKGMIRYVWLNVATMLMSLCIPAIAVAY